MQNNEENKKAITITFPDGQSAKRITDMIVRKKPMGWGRGSSATYYKEQYAEWLKNSLDMMLQDGQSIVFRYASYPKHSENSLYLRVNQAWRYLIDFLDKDGKYKKLQDQVRVHRKKGVGVIIESFEDDQSLKQVGEHFIPESLAPKWRAQIDEYLQATGETTPFHLSGLILSKEEIEQLEVELSGLENIMFSINSHEIKIIKGA